MYYPSWGWGKKISWYGLLLAVGLLIPIPGFNQQIIRIVPVISSGSDGFPDATSTGVPAGTTLTVVNGDQDIVTNGTIIDSKDIRGCITVDAPNVIIRKSKVSCPGIAIFNNSSNLLVEDTTIDCQGVLGGTAITWRNYTARRINASDCENVLWAEGDVTIEDSYIHDLIEYNIVTDPHPDGIQVPTSANITIRHNRIYGMSRNLAFSNSAVTSSGGISNYLLTDNLLAGGGYTVYCDGIGNTNYRVTNNRFSTIFSPTVGFYGPIASCETTATQFSGNVYHETGLPLPGQ